MQPLRPTWAEIDLGAIVGNYRAMAERVGVAVMGIVKADAYGHGAVPVAKALADLRPPMFAVAITQEAIELRQAGITQPILVLGCILSDEIAAACGHDLTLQISDLALAREVSRRAVGAGRPVRVHLKVDTGMGRAGMSPDEAVEAAAAMAALPGIELDGLMTHFPSSDETSGEAFTRGQIQAFGQCIAKLDACGIRPRWRHAANSGAVLAHPPAWLDMVRPGMALYGCYPGPEAQRTVPLRQAMTLKTRVVLTKDVPSGRTLSYGRTFTTRRATRVALLPIGYDDGMDRRLSNCGEVLIRGARCPILGRVCMDQCLADVTHVPAAGVGDEVVIYGRQGDERILIEDVAARIGTIPNVLVCAVSRRVPRVYVGGRPAAGG